MALNALLARMEGRAVTPVTAYVTPDVTPKPAPIKACTAVTFVTACEANSWAWLLHFTDRDPVEVYFSPVVAHTEALAAYPEAVAAEPIPEVVKRTVTTQEAAELSRLAARVAAFHQFTEADRAEALHHALADPDAALACFRLLAAEIPTDAMLKGCNDEH